MAGNTNDAGVMGFHDAAKATREIFRIIDDLVKRGGRVVEAYRWYKRKKAARALDVLRFKEGNFLRVLRDIEEGEFTEKDVATVREILTRTRSEVEESIDQLERLVGFLREQIGMDSALRLEDILHGDEGKGDIRLNLDQLSRVRIGHVVGADPGEKEIRRRVRQDATKILESIELLNEKIIALHEDILRETGARKTRSSAKRSSKKKVTKRT